MARIAGLVVGGLVMLAFWGLLLEEGVRLYRGWRNTDGTTVTGYGLYEKRYSSPVVEKELGNLLSPDTRESRQGWELTEFYQWEVQCRILAASNQRTWAGTRARILARGERSTEGRPLFTESDLPVERYRCVPMNMLYRAGMGWGLFGERIAVR